MKIFKSIADWRSRLWWRLEHPAWPFDLDKIHLINPDFIDANIVSQVFVVSPQTAKRLCETAVRQGFFERISNGYRVRNKGDRQV